MALRVLAEASVSISAFSRSLVSVTDARALEVGKQWTRRFAAVVTLDAVSGISPHFNKAGFTTGEYSAPSIMLTVQTMGWMRLRTPSVGRRVGNGCEGIDSQRLS